MERKKYIGVERKTCCKNLVPREPLLYYNKMENWDQDFYMKEDNFTLVLKMIGGGM